MRSLFGIDLGGYRTVRIAARHAIRRGDDTDFYQRKVNILITRKPCFQL